MQCSGEKCAGKKYPEGKYPKIVMAAYRFNVYVHFLYKSAVLLSTHFFVLLMRILSVVLFCFIC